MSSETELINRIQNLFNEKFFQVELAQVKAKALLKEVSQEIPKYRWSYVAPRIIRNITAVGFGLETLSLSSPYKLEKLEAMARLVARTWESLAKLGERTSRSTALVNAAISYEIAGYQANAACLARQLNKDFSNIVKPSLDVIASAFLQRLFLRVRLLSIQMLQEPTALETMTKDMVSKAVVSALAAEGFDNASLYFLSGQEESLSRAKQSFEESEQIFAALGAVEEYNLVHGIRSLLPIMREKSTWNLLLNFVPNNRRWERYLKLLARGTGASILRCPSVSELWPSQILALRSGLLTSFSKVIKMPTSAGKTRVAELAIVHTLVTKPGAKCVYIAPYRALVSELEQAFLNLFGDLGFRVSSVIGTYESDDFEQLLVSDADILVTTPEKLDLLQRIEPKFLNDVHLFIMDEGQIVHDPQRGTKFELLFTRLKRRLLKARFLFLSAVVPQETLEDFARWFGANPSEDVLVSDWRPSIQRYAKFEWKGQSGVIRYSPDEDIPLHQEFQEFVSGVIKQKTYEFTNPETGRINRRSFPEPTNKGQTAAELAFKFAELGPVLVFCSQTNFVEAVAKSLEARLDLARLTGEDMPSYFLPSGQTRSLISATEWLGDDHLVTRILRNNIAIHYGDLPETVRKSIELDFRERRLRILIATNTLAQGVNLPIRTVVVHSCWRRTPEGEAQRIPARDYWNIAGRAGRAGEETEGTIIHIIMSRQDEKDFEYYRQSREKVEPVESALFQLLNDLVNERLSEDAVQEKLDPEILALLVEEGVDFLNEDSIRKFLSETLVEAQAKRHATNIGRLDKVFLSTATDITRIVPSRDDRSAYSSTGLSTRSCKKLEEYILANKDNIGDMLRQAGSKELEKMVALFLEGCLTLPEMQPSRVFGGSYSELLLRWLSGASIHNLALEFGDQTTSVEELAKFIEDLFSYRLPWGISAMIRIATKVLGIKNDELSNYTKFFPSMAKFGVPNPVASWALAAGVPFRDTAIKLATRFINEGNVGTYEDFLKWLGRIDSETLRYEFGLRSPFLEDVGKALYLAGYNELLAQHAFIKEVLPLDTWVRGISYENRRIVAMEAKVGQSVEFARDNDNLVDRNAVKVLLDKQTLGFLERQLAQLVAPDLDCGLILRGVITDIERGDVPQVKVRIQV